MKKMNRRTLIRRSVAAATGFAGLPFIFRSVARAASPSASNRINVGCIGIGWQGGGNMDSFLNESDAQVVAVCDVDANHLRDAKRKVDSAYGNQDCKAYGDFRELLARPDIDAVCLSLPDHWHGLIGVAVAKAGKDIFGEKPLTHNLREGRLLCDAVKHYGRIWQTGSWQRSVSHFRQACELVRNGRIGKLQRALVAIGPNNKQAPPSDWKPMPVPEWLDYEMWLGPAPWAPYHKDRCLYTFRFGVDYSGGQTTNLGAHGIDIVQWANGTDDTGPVEIEDLGGEFPSDGLFTTATKVHFRARYANGAELVCRTQEDEIYRFEGTEGWIQVPTYSDEITCQPESLRTTVIGPDEIHLYESNDHHRNFVDCIKTRGQTAAPVEVGHRSVTICHLGNIAMQLKSRLRWDPVAERFTDSHEANTLLSRAMRSPWHL